MAKTIKYFIEFENIENSMLAKMEISKKEYFRQIAFLDNKHRITIDNEEIEDQEKMEKREYRHEYESTITTITYYTIACADTILTKIECKKGYVFK